jgi:hypothetical protein
MNYYKFIHQLVLFVYYTIIILIIDFCFDIVHTDIKFEELEEVTLTTEISTPRAIFY